jgi:folate-dependent phosphoribosylglycinamide formyltransferase PurN
VTRLLLLAPAGLNAFQLAVVRHLLARRGGDIVGCLIDDRRPEALRRKAVRHLRRGRGGYTLVLAARVVARPLRRCREPAVRIDGLIEGIGVSIIRSADPYGDETIEALKRLRPDVLLLIGGFGIVKEPLLTLAPAGVLSYHHGDMRRYRGQPAGFWELYNGEPSMGVTIQRLAAGIDCGEPILERQYEIRADDSLQSLMSRVYAASSDMLLEALQRVETGASPLTLETLGRVYTLPNLRQWLAFRCRVAARRTRARTRSHLAPGP